MEIHGVNPKNCGKTAGKPRKHMAKAVEKLMTHG